MVGNRGSLAAGLLQATSLTFIVAATGIGIEPGLLNPATGAAMVVAGLLSVLLLPLGALTLLRTGEKPAGQRDDLAAHEPRRTRYGLAAERSEQ